MPAQSIKADHSGPTGLGDLPAEVRLQIYPHLFQSREKDYCSQVWMHTQVLIRNISRHKDMEPSVLGAVCFEIPQRFHDRPAPQILATCKTIHREATSALYADNTFQFHLPESDTTFPWNSKKVQGQCDNLFRYDSEHWRNKSPPVLRDSSLARSLHQIGPTNAACLTSLDFCAYDSDLAAEQIPLITELAARYLPSLRSVELSVNEKKVSYDESPEYYHPDYSSPFWANGTFEPMYRALIDFTTRITWLTKFTYDGQEHFGPFDSEYHEGWDLLTGLETWVAARAAGHAVERYPEQLQETVATKTEANSNEVEEAENNA
ncbi:hypothetical protein MMC28_011511 [Mycoblastus sanguinarius]|nr:hypothetical protein [Mycoblastus sanguinarius]